MKKNYILLLIIFFLTSSISIFSQQEYYTGFKPAPKEELEKIKPFEEGKFRGEIKSSIDMSEDFPPVGNQGRLMSCVAWSIAYVLSYYHHSSHSSYYTSGNEIDCNAIYSPAFIYNSLNYCTNGGILYTDALAFVKEYGIVDLCEMPYDTSDYCTLPTREQYNKARSNRIHQFYNARGAVTAEMLKEKMNEGFPILIGVYVDNAFITKYKSNETANYVWGGYKDRDLYGHAMIIVGYDNDKSAFKVMNSWGTSWGENGFIWISYDFISYCTIEAYYMDKN